MTRFDVTYELFTESLLEEGDTVETGGFIAEWVSLRDAIQLVTETESHRCEQLTIEASDSCTAAARWFTVYNNADWVTGETENRSLHIPHHVTGASRRRIARLLGVRVG
jgi:hypothetical protein